MQKMIISILMASLLVACASNGKLSQTGGKDAYGCVVKTGTKWSHLKQECINVEEVADIRFSEMIDGQTYEGYAILSDDKYIAEVFSFDSADNLMLKSVKGGFISDDNKVRLMKRENGWKLSVK